MKTRNFILPVMWTVSIHFRFQATMHFERHLSTRAQEQKTGRKRFYGCENILLREGHSISDARTDHQKVQRTEGMVCCVQCLLLFVLIALRSKLGCRFQLYPLSAFHAQTETGNWQERWRSGEKNPGKQTEIQAGQNRQREVNKDQLFFELQQRQTGN